MPNRPKQNPHRPTKTCGDQCQDCRVWRLELRRINPFDLGKGIFEEMKLAGSYATAGHVTADRRPLGLDSPPWKADDPGPSSMGAYVKAIARHELSIYGGGLWNFECDPWGDDEPRLAKKTITVDGVRCTYTVAEYPWIPRNTRRNKKTLMPETGIDLALLKEYVKANGAEGAQMAAYVRVVEQGMTISGAARDLGVDRSNLRQDLRRLQGKAKKWRTRVHGGVMGPQ